MRQFLAAPLPPECRERLRALRRDLEPGLRGWRWIEADRVHLTLRFLGEVDEATDRRARAEWRAAAAACPSLVLRLGRLGRFPARGAPRVLWLSLARVPPALAELQAALEAAARRLGFEAEDRPFRPHLTLARARPRERPAPPPPDEPAEPGSVPLERIVLFRSELGSGGARYTALETFPLAGVAGTPGGLRDG